MKIDFYKESSDQIVFENVGGMKQFLLKRIFMFKEQNLQGVCDRRHRYANKILFILKQNISMQYVTWMIYSAE